MPAHTYTGVTTLQATTFYGCRILAGVRSKPVTARLATYLLNHVAWLR